MSVKKWMSKLEGDFTKVAASMPKPSDNVISIPSPSFNWAVGNGGLTEGKAVCFFGPESSGKSLLCQLVLIELQKKYPESIQILIDAEFSFNPTWFQKLGGDLNRLLVKQTNDPLQIFDWIEKDVLEMLQDGAPINGLMIDSIKSIRYPGDIKNKSTDITMGGSGAKYLGPALKGLLPIIRQYSITTLLVQQIYEEMDQYKKMNNPYIVPDGRSLKHFCDYMLQVDRIDSKIGRLEDGKNMVGGANQIGHKVRVKGKKNRVGAPYRVAEFSLRYDTGIVDTESEIYELAKSMGIIHHPVSIQTGKPNNMMWAFKDYPHVKGEANMKQFITGDARVLDEAYKTCLDADDEMLSMRNQELKEQAEDIDIDIEEL
jgi:recombination protein RecA